jgi:hypothetical protein
VADRTFTLYAEAAGGEKVGYLEEVVHHPDAVEAGCIGRPSNLG